MTKQKNKLKTSKARSQKTARKSPEPFLMEKQVVSDLNFLRISERREQQIQCRKSVEKKNQAAKRRGRLQEIKWSHPETSRLYQLHNQFGNKWKEIARYFPGRSDNNIKNHFFSRLRLSLRQLNKVIFKLFGPKKQIKDHTFYKITSFCQLKFKDNSNEKHALIQEATTLKERILNFIQGQPFDETAVQLWKSINSFSNKTGHNKGKMQQLSGQFQSQEASTHLNNREIEQANTGKNQIQKHIQVISNEQNALRSISDDDFVMTRNLTPNQAIFINIPPLFSVEKTQEECIEKPAIVIPGNLFLSPIRSVEDSVFNLNISDQSYFSQNQNLSFYTDFVDQKQPQFQSIQKDTL